MSLWTMKEVIRMTGTTENALRYYSAKGVVPPSAQETEGRRQWLYDDTAIERLKKLFLLQYLGMSIEEAGKAMEKESYYQKEMLKTLKELKKKRDRLDQKIFIAQTLAVAYGQDLFKENDETDGTKAAVLNELLRELVIENAER